MEFTFLLLVVARLVVPLFIMFFSGKMSARINPRGEIYVPPAANGTQHNGGEDDDSGGALNHGRSRSNLTCYIHITRNMAKDSTNMVSVAVFFEGGGKAHVF